jgi:hypothetical protein
MHCATAFVWTFWHKACKLKSLPWTKPSSPPSASKPPKRTDTAELRAIRALVLCIVGSVSGINMATGKNTARPHVGFSTSVARAV